MVMYDKEFETMGNEIWTKNNIEPQHIHQMLIILIKRIKDSKEFQGGGVGVCFLNWNHSAKFYNFREW